MLSYTVYKLFHILGMLLVFVAAGGAAVHAAAGGDKEANPLRRGLVIAHGVGLVLLLVAGFGMLARIGASAASGWVFGKLAIWLIMGASTVLPYKVRGLAGAMLSLLPLLGALAAYLALYKPF